MKTSTKRTLWISGFVLALLVAIGAYLFFIATNRALSRAESFEFRRMQVARVDDSDIFRFFFATNRRATDADQPLLERLGNARSPALTFGSFDTESEDGRVALVDVTPVNRTRNFHNFSLEVPEYFDDMFLRLTNSGSPLNRQRYQFRTPDGKRYSVLTRGR